MDKSTKNLIIDVLSEEWPLSARVIWNKLRKDYSKSITYQAVYKLIQKMLEDKIIIKKENKYNLSKIWIKESKDFFSILDKNYDTKKVEKIPYSKSHLKKSVRYSFKTLSAMGNYAANYFTDFPNPEKKPFISRCFEMYSLLSLPREHLLKVKKVIEKYGAYCLCNSNTLYDRLIARSYLAYVKNLKIKLRSKDSDECDYIVLGDYVMRVYFSPEVKKITSVFKKGLRSFFEIDFKTMFEVVNKEFDTPNYLVIEKNPEIAEQIRQNTLKYFKK